MPVLVRCPECSAKLKADDALLGRRERCPKCRALIRVEPALMTHVPDADAAGLFLEVAIVPRPIPPGRASHLTANAGESSTLLAHGRAKD